MWTPQGPILALCGLMLVAACSSDSGTAPEDDPEDIVPPEVGVLDRSLIPTYPEELELKLSCYDGPDGAFTQDCPVLMWDGITYWALSHNDNRSGMTILAFDTQQSLVGTWERTGARYIWQITVDEVAETVTFWGQGTGSFEVSWEDLQS